MPTKEQTEKFVTAGMELANKVFEKKGNRSTVRFDLNNLSALLALAYEMGYNQGKRDNTAFG
jgi:hypothetical protein